MNQIIPIDLRAQKHFSVAATSAEASCASVRFSSNSMLYNSLSLGYLYPSPLSNGRKMVRLSVESDGSGEWLTKCEKRTPNYLTDIDELMMVG